MKSIRYRGTTYKLALGMFVISFVALGYLGLQPATEKVYVYAARMFASLYFLFFLLMPFYTRAEKTRAVPERVVYTASH